MRLFPVTAFAGVMMLLVACGNGSGDQDVVGGDNNVTRPDNGTINFDVVNPDIPTINKECQTEPGMPGKRTAANGGPVRSARRNGNASSQRPWANPAGAVSRT